MGTEAQPQTANLQKAAEPNPQSEQGLREAVNHLCADAVSYRRRLSAEELRDLTPVHDQQLRLHGAIAELLNFRRGAPSPLELRIRDLSAKVTSLQQRLQSALAERELIVADLHTALARADQLEQQLAEQNRDRKRAAPSPSAPVSSAPIHESDLTQALQHLADCAIHAPGVDGRVIAKKAGLLHDTITDITRLAVQLHRIARAAARCATSKELAHELTWELLDAHFTQPKATENTETTEVETT